jgi:hypothetical protein
MICIHPTAAHNAAQLASLQIETGLRVTRGQTFLRLINPDGSLPAAKPAPRKSITYRTNWNGGGDAA